MYIYDKGFLYKGDYKWQNQCPSVTAFFHFGTHVVAPAFGRFFLDH